MPEAIAAAALLEQAQFQCAVQRVQQLNVGHWRLEQRGGRAQVAQRDRCEVGRGDELEDATRGAVDVCQPSDLQASEERPSVSAPGRCGVANQRQTMAVAGQFANELQNEEWIATRLAVDVLQELAVDRTT